MQAAILEKYFHLFINLFLYKKKIEVNSCDYKRIIRLFIKKNLFKRFSAIFTKFLLMYHKLLRLIIID